MIRAHYACYITMAGNGNVQRTRKQYPNYNASPYICRDPVNAGARIKEKKNPCRWLPRATSVKGHHVSGNYLFLAHQSQWSRVHELHLCRQKGKGLLL